MKIRIKQAVIILVLSFLLCGCSVNDKVEGQTPDTEAQDAEKESLVEALTGKVVVSGVMNADMRMEDGQCMEWLTEEMTEREIDGRACYALDLWYADDETNGEMAGRLFASYAVSKDGTAFYWYHPADDVWEPLAEAESEEAKREDNQNTKAGENQNEEPEHDQNEEPENIQELPYDINEYGTVQENTREFTDEATGKMLYYYRMEKFFFHDDSIRPHTECTAVDFPNASLVNQTLQHIYDKYEESYIEEAEDYKCAEDEYLNTPFQYWHILNIEYVGDDYISILYNDVFYMGGAHPYSQFDGITIDCATGEEVLASQLLEESDEEILNKILAEMGDKKGFDMVGTWDDIDFYLTDSSIVFFYRTPGFYENVVLPREKWL